MNSKRDNYLLWKNIIIIFLLEIVRWTLRTAWARDGPNIAWDSIKYVNRDSSQ
jgi:hypothetical protein